MILEDVFAQTNRFINKTSDKEEVFYFIAAHTINGARFYSETFDDVITAANVYNKYEDLVQYFDGGTVELFKIDSKDFDIIAISRV